MKVWTDMTGEEKAKRSIHCAIGSVIIALICVGLVIYLNGEAQKLRDRCTETVTGEVISVFPATKSRIQSYLTANYSVNGIKYKTAGHYRSGYSSSDTLSRKPVTVHYDPASPDIYYAADDPKTDARNILIVIACIFGLGAPLFVWQAKRVRNS